MLGKVENKTLKAEKLKLGDKIAFFSPSSPATVFAPKRFERAKKFIENKGFTLIPGKLTNKSDYYRSANALARAEELNELIRNPEVKAIISTIGGYNANAILPFIDYSALIKNPKIIMGYSDVTALLLGIYEKTGLVTFYGPALVASFGEFPPLVDETFNSFDEILCQPPKLPYHYKMPTRWTDSFIDWESQTKAKALNLNNWYFLGKGKYRGRLIGGNLNTLSGIWGSP
ncbi:microcin immunity protein MccF [Marinomonas sp. MED121]|uniref:S66 family peptidase n=1 Tax=Marinomonas sp. MED121 TaxID=314277 RepID=UPI00006901A7|nr:S66 peptidase family protein [Marinomonas sp. MED121]EAQ64395.1 microcin immunity protein MccF [Marinomonas sp. MED121]